MRHIYMIHHNLGNTGDRSIDRPTARSPHAHYGKPVRERSRNPKKKIFEKKQIMLTNILRKSLRETDDRGGGGGG